MRIYSLKECTDAVPVVPEKMNWIFLNKTARIWEAVAGKEKPTVQFAAFGTPLSARQFQKLTEKAWPDRDKPGGAE